METRADIRRSLPSDRFAGFWVRVVAYAIDGAILLIPQLLLRWGASQLGGGRLHPFRTGMLSFFVVTFLYYSYFGLLQAYLGGTPGKKALGLEVRDETGSPMGVGQATLRFLMTYVNAAAFCLGYANVGWDPFKQGWHDKVARTVVLKRARVQIAPLALPPPAEEPSDHRKAA